MPSKPDLFGSALLAEGVSGKLADLARSIYAQESGGGKNTKTSNRGAVGGMQVTPGAFSDVADKGWSITDPEHNLRAGIRYLKLMYAKSGGDPALTAAGYYGGTGGMNKARQGIAVSDPQNPKAPNTLQYGQQVVARMGGQPVPVMGAAPAALPEGAALQVAAVAPPPGEVRPGPVPLPPEVMAQLSSQPIQTPPSMEMGPDAWQAFLKSIPGQAQPVNVADIDYGNPQMAVRLPAFQFQPTANQVPNFQAFSSWRGKAA